MSIDHLISPSVQLVVPDDHRPYLWGPKQIQPLWDTISAGASSPSAHKDYFLGSVVLEVDRYESPMRIRLIDGYQRIMTLLVVLCAMRDHMSLIGLPIGDSITSRYLHAESYNAETTYRLVAHQADRPNFTAIIEGDGDVGATGRVADAYKFMRRRLLDACPNLDDFQQAFSWLHGVSAVVREGIVMAALSFDKEAAASLLPFLYQSNPKPFRRLIAEDKAADDVIAFAHRREQVSVFRKYLEDDNCFDRAIARTARKRGEDVWQQFFEKNPWILGASLGGQLLVSWDPSRLEQAVTGSSISGVGKRTDALLRTAGRIRSMVFAEFKTHRTALLDKDVYRSGCWIPSKHVTGGVSQLQGTVHRAVRHIGNLINDHDEEGAAIPGEATYLIRPRSYLIVGQLADLFSGGGGVREDKFVSFELYRRSITEPEIVTFDELLSRAEWMAGISQIP
ncbi:Shedu anti-phage system protein SduA domain-containing protein [Microtetraspora malaysiensis]|uniref:Shedu anti-phage system protein SduA domain-containing protein n=1 Tax=Microtetraspora malaysiensis TaxID=161358 RepID=UPI001FE07B14|nr:Shedu anti-phage system protein SduA domain-containing protein [Microtetraspora malaysiensis]